MRTDVLGFFLSLQREFCCFTGKAIWNVTSSEVRVKRQTAVIMSAGQRSRERNFFQSLGHRSRAGRACVSCLEINWFHFLLWVLGEREWKGYQRGRMPPCSRAVAENQAKTRLNKKGLFYSFFPWAPLPWLGSQGGCWSRSWLHAGEGRAHPWTGAGPSLSIWGFPYLARATSGVSFSLSEKQS